MFEIGPGTGIGEKREIVFREICDGDDKVEDFAFPVLSNVNTDHVYISEALKDHIILGIQVEDEVSTCLCSVGTVTSRRWMASAKNKLWWMTPSWGDDVSDIPVETQFLLVELDSDGWYAIFLPLIHDGTFTAMLRGGSKGDRCGFCQTCIECETRGRDTAIKWYYTT